ncbi:PKD domain-containing protein [Bacterioplanoides sp.]|uniref:PKD domain-containing protein n=1 Tax=Bacterioplanoides sp. TaxID=2066072 RepID=UPI003B001AFB
MKYFSCVLIAVVFSTLLACGGGGGGSSNGDSNNSGGGNNSGGNNTGINAGADQLVSKQTSVTLDGSASRSDSSGDYIWTQTRGPDVTNGSGSLSGVSPAFTAPDTVDTLIFSLRIGASSATDEVVINVLEQTTNIFFVDGDNGNDGSGDGSLAAPFRTISHALGQISQPDTDIYVRTLSSGQRYNETGATLFPPENTSLYGGYDESWWRDTTNNRTGLNGARVAVNFANVAADAWLSGFDIQAASSDSTDLPVSAVSADSGTESLFIENNTLTAGAVGDGQSSNPASSYGVRIANIASVEITGNTIVAGKGGDGASPASRERGLSGGNGAAADGRDGGNGGAAGNVNAGGNKGGDGGRGGGTLGGNGEAGDNGFRISDVPGSAGTGGAGGAGGSGGSSTNFGGAGKGGVGGDGGDGGDGGTEGGTIAIGGFFRGDNGNTGQTGSSGAGGGGGGGGEGSFATLGGGGGGGGGGGRSGVGGTGGPGGGASIGVLLYNVLDAMVENNTITAASGGRAGAGGFGGIGGTGGNGGIFEPSDAGGAERGGRGGGGGRGGSGGQGGSGAGGPSYAVMVGADLAPMIRNNTLITAEGGPTNSGGSPGSDGSDGADGDFAANPGAGGTGAGTTSSGDFGTPAFVGASYGIYDADTGDGVTPVRSGNQFSQPSNNGSGPVGEANF